MWLCRLSKEETVANIDPRRDAITAVQARVNKTHPYVQVQIRDQKCQDGDGWWVIQAVKEHDGRVLKDSRGPIELFYRPV